MSHFRLFGVLCGLMMLVGPMAQGQPSAPINVTISGGAGQHPTVSWADTSLGLAGFKVYRKIGSYDTAFTVIATVNASTHSYTDGECFVRSAPPGQTAYYKIRAFDSLDRLSDFSAQVAKLVLYAPPKLGTGNGRDGLTPKQFELSPAYPNPFNPSTSIRFGLPVEAHIRLTVFDALGREVALLADGAMPAGYHTYRWQARGMASGLYLLRLQVRDDLGKILFSRSQSLLLVK